MPDDMRHGAKRRRVPGALAALAALAAVVALAGGAVGIWNLVDTTEPVDAVRIAP